MTLGLALRIAFGGRSATAWRTDEVKATLEWQGADAQRPRLIFTWVIDPDAGWIPLVTSLSAESALPVVLDWLRNASYGSEPDHDGDNGKGWRVYCEGWGHVEPYGYQALVAIEPRWAMYGK